MVDILFIGINPSDKSPDDSAFHEDTKSGKTLRGWIKAISLKEDDVDFYNVVPYKTDKPLSRKHLNLEMIVADLKIFNPTKIVALGKLADVTLGHLGIPHFAMNHPSGLSRKNNDKKALDEKLQQLKEYLCDQPSTSSTSAT